MADNTYTELLDPMWYQHAEGKEYIAGGLLDGGDPLLFVRKRVNNTLQLLCKCAGTNGEFIPVSEFANAMVCSSCSARTGFAVLPSNCSDDLAFGKCDYYPPVNVPTGCPHALCNEHIDTDAFGSPFSSDGCSRSAARTVMLENKRTVISPHSWRLTANGDKITLTIQYRQRYIDMEKGSQSEKSLYRNICADLSSGRSYVSERADSTRKYRRHKGSAAIEDMTYTGFSTYSKNCGSTEYSQLKWGFEKMYEFIREQMMERGYQPADYHVCASGQQHEFGTLFKKISAMNRFPNLGYIPLVDIRHMLPERYMKMVNKLPRDISCDSVLSGLAIPSSPELVELVKKNPSYLEIAFVLARIGCHEASDIVYACDESRISELAQKLGMCVAFKAEYGAAGLDIAPMFFPKLMPSSGWRGLIDLLVEMNLSDAEQMFLNCAKMISRGEQLPFNLNLEQPRANLSLPTGVKPPLPSFEWESKALSSKWKFVQNEGGCDNRFYSTSTAPALTITLLQDDEVVARIELSGRPRLDRRKWSEKVNLRYIEKVVELQRVREARSDHARFDSILAELGEYEKKLIESYVYDYKIHRIIPTSLPGNLFLPSIKPEAAKLIARWTSRFGFPTESILNCDSVMTKAFRKYEQGKRKRRKRNLKSPEETAAQKDNTHIETTDGK